MAMTFDNADEQINDYDIAPEYKAIMSILVDELRETYEVPENTESFLKTIDETLPEAIVGIRTNNPEDVGKLELAGTGDSELFVTFTVPEEREYIDPTTGYSDDKGATWEQVVNETDFKGDENTRVEKLYSLNQIKTVLKGMDKHA